jgi:hypothetical protein
MLPLIEFCQISTMSFINSKTKKKKSPVRKVRNFKKTAGSSLVPFFEARCCKEDESELMEKVGKHRYYAAKAAKNRAVRGQPDRKISKEMVFILQDKKRLLKKRMDAIEKKREMEEIDHGWL